jgi:hypothetical protein
MKNKFKISNSLIVFSISIFFFSACSTDDVSSQKTENLSLSRSLPPPTPGELRGLYDITFNNGSEANLLFEYYNYVSYGSPTLFDKTTIPGFRTSYTNVSGNVYVFTCSDSGVNYNFRFTYDSDSAKMNGTYGTGSSYTNLGTFQGKKHITGNSGFEFLKGYWLGTYSGSYDYLMVFEEDGKVTVGTGATYYSSVIGKGFYQINGGTVSGYYVYPGGSKYSFIGQFNYLSKTITGTWGVGTNNNNGGSFTLGAMNFY